MRTQEPQHYVQESSQQLLIDRDPYGPSYPESAIQYLPYRIGILVFAIVMIILGKSNLPSNSVPCIQDVILDFLLPITEFYIENKQFGLILVSIMQVIVDGQLVLMVIYWAIKGQNTRYPIILGVIGLSKMLLNVLFETKLIEPSFNERAFPSLIFGQNFENTYFFSGVVCLLMANLLELHELGFRKIVIIQSFILIYVGFILLSAHQNFFMDVTTALVFTHYLFYFVNARINTFDKWVFMIYDKLAGKQQEDKEKYEN